MDVDASRTGETSGPASRLPVRWFTKAQTIPLGQATRSEARRAVEHSRPSSAFAQLPGRLERSRAGCPALVALFDGGEGIDPFGFYRATCGTGTVSEAAGAAPAGRFRHSWTPPGGGNPAGAGPRPRRRRPPLLLPVVGRSAHARRRTSSRRAARRRQPRAFGGRSQGRERGRTRQMEVFGPLVAHGPSAARYPETTKPPCLRGLLEVGGTGLEPVTPSLSSWCSPN